MLVPSRALLLAALLWPAGARGTPDVPARDEAHGNDNTRPAGRRAGDTLDLALEARLVTWRPGGEAGPTFTVHAFAERGRDAQIPGPLLRVPVGTTVRVRLRNTLSRELRVAGLGARNGTTLPDTLVVAAGAERVVTFRALQPGSFYYDANTTHPDDPPSQPTPNPEKCNARDKTLVGAIVVDSAGARTDDRIFVFHPGGDRETTARLRVRDRKLFVNGTSWPYSERLHYTAGDTVRWRVINVAFLPHPLHLHGFYFRVDARGTLVHDTVYAPADRRWAVTELVQGFTTARLTWVPTREGNWLFHCHFLQHMSLRQSLAPGGDAAARALPAAPTAHAHGNHALDGMAGLILGIHVAPRPGVAPVRHVRRAERRLRLLATRRDSVFGSAPGYGFVLQTGRTPPAADSVRRPGTPLLLTRGEPVAITVVNTLGKPLAVHWHGMELESEYDGVGDWSGVAERLRPPIAPRDSFVVRFTPARAGTFIYHTHDETGRELASGLYGPLVVLEPGQRFDSRTDHLLVMASGVRAPEDTSTRPADPVLNGRSTPAPLTLAAGRTHRLRLTDIADGDIKYVRLLTHGAPARWRPVAKDGAALPPAQATAREAVVTMGVGETYDVELPPGAGEYELVIDTWFYPATPKSSRTMRVPVVVR
jgi:FtsP/CotA-like multicopper oxidase with cupredoxin domain